MKLAELRREYLRRCVVYVLCGFCRFAEFTDDHEPVCQHPLADRAVGVGVGCGMEPGDDCWAFRPAPDCGLDVVDERIVEWQAAEREER